MARFLIVGSLAWDRPLRLSAPLIAGGRLFAFSDEADGALPAGRLGGGAANAGCALVNSGHTAAVYAAVSDDTNGENIMNAAVAAGLDLRFVQRVPGWGSETLLLIQPDGERVVMGYMVGGSADRAQRQAMKRAITPPAPSVLNAFAPAGIYLRAALSGHDALTPRSSCLTVAHWPLAGADAIPADVLVGSADDLPGIDDPFAAGQAATGGRLKWAVVTRGADGGTAYGPDGAIDYVSPKVTQFDATGAGDCFAAGLLEALTAGAAISDALSHAARWGAITAGREGSAIVDDAGTYPSFSRSAGPKAG